MSATNPFTRPSPFRPSIQPTSPYSNPTSSMYGNNIVQSQVRAIGGGYNSGRPSFGLSSSPYAGGSSQYQAGLFKGIGMGNKNTGTSNLGILGLGINTGIITNTNIPTHDTSLTNLNTDPYTLSTKQNPFRRTSLLNNNYTQNNPISQSNTSNTDYYSILPTNTINNTSISTNGYQHLRYTPSSASSTPPNKPSLNSLNPRPSLTPSPLTRIQSNPKIQPTNTDRYSNLAYTPSPSSNYNAYNYNTVNNDKSDSASVCSYINRISQLDDELGMGVGSGGGNPFNRKNIIGGNNYKFDNDGVVQYKKDDTLYPSLQKKDYSHLQYKGSNNQNNTNININIPYNIDKYRYNYQQQSKSKTKQHQPSYPSNNYPNKYTQNQQQSQHLKYSPKNQYQPSPPPQLPQTKTSPYSAQAIEIANNIINPLGSSNRFNNNFGGRDGSGRDSRGKVNSLEKYRQRSPDRTQAYNRYQVVDSITKKYQFQDYNVHDQQQEQMITQPRNNPYNYPNNQQQPKSNNYPIDPIPRLNINNPNNNKYNDDLQYNFNHKSSYQYQHQQELNRVQSNNPNYRNYSNNMMRGQEKFDQNYINNKDKDKDKDRIRDREQYQLNNSLDQYQSPQFGTTLNRNQLKKNNNFPSQNLRNIIRFDDEDQGYESQRQRNMQNINNNNNNKNYPKTDTNTNTNTNTKQIAYESRLKDRNREQIPTFQSKGKNKNYPSTIIYKGMELYRVKLE